MIKYHIPLVFNSSVESGALNKSADGSSFSVFLSKGVFVPEDAKYCWMVCQNAEIWNTVPNIITGVNDKLYFEDGGGAVLITIPEGLYNIELLNNEIDRQLVDAGRTSGTVTIFGNDATQKTVIQFNAIDDSLDWNPADTVRDILGFNAGVIIATSPGELFDGDVVANFNNIDSFLVHCDLISHGLRVNNNYNQAVASVPITSPAGLQIIYEPQNPPEIPSNELIGQKKNTIRCFLTDSNNNLVNTFNENYLFRIVIYYVI